MEFLKLCGVAAVTVIVAALVKRFRPGLAVAVSAGGCMLLLAGALTVYSEPLAFITGQLSALMPEGSLTILLKSAGVALVAGFAADLCRGLGEDAVAARVEAVGQAEILLLSLPLAAQLLEISRGLLGG